MIKRITVLIGIVVMISGCCRNPKEVVTSYKQTSRELIPYEQGVTIVLADTNDREYFLYVEEQLSSQESRDWCPKKQYIDSFLVFNIMDVQDTLSCWFGINRDGEPDGFKVAFNSHASVNVLCDDAGSFQYDSTVVYIDTVTVNGILYPDVIRMNFYERQYDVYTIMKYMLYNKTAGIIQVGITFKDPTKPAPDNVSKKVYSLKKVF